MTSLLHDLHHGWRALRKRSGFTVAAALVLAVGIGADVTLFSVANGLLLQTPLADVPERILNVHAEAADGSGFHGFSYLDAVDMGHDEETVLVAPWSLSMVSLSTPTALEPTEPRITASQLVGHRYFDVFGVPPAAGRYFNADSVAENSDVVVVGHRLGEALGEDAIGSTVRVNQRPLTVVGIAPKGLTGPIGLVETELWMPLELQPLIEPSLDLAQRGSVWLEMVVRLRDGVSESQAEALLDARYAQLAELRAAGEGGPVNGQVVETGVHLTPLGQVPGQARGPMKVFLGILLAAVSLLLLLTCFDVAGMLLSRAAERQREFAVRLALGAGRIRLAQQMVTENLLLFALGGSAGLLLAHWATRLLAQVQLPLPVDLAVDFRVDTTVSLYCFGVTLLVGVLFGMTPAFYGSRLDLRSHLKDGAARGGTRLRGRRFLVAAQIAAAMMLLTVSGLFLRALVAANHMDPGFEPANVQMAQLDLSVHGYSKEAGLDLYQQLHDRIEARPGVTSAGYLRLMHLGLGNMTTDFLPEGHEPPPGNTSYGTDYTVIDDGYFETLGVPLLAGRGFGAHDRDGVVIVNEAVAQRFWPGRSPLGQRIHLGDRTAPTAEIVGVAGTASYRSLGEEPRFYLYLPMKHYYESEMTLLVQHDPDMPGDRIASAVREEIRALDPDMPVTAAVAVSDFIAISLLPQRIASAVLSFAGLVGLLLVAVGIYGITAFAVVQRTREMGVRRALGATGRDVLRLVLGEGLRLAMAGIAAGWLLSLVIAQLLRGFLPGISPLDPWVFSLIPSILLLAVLFGCLVPAQQAARIHPLEALRYE